MVRAFDRIFPARHRGEGRVELGEIAGLDKDLELAAVPQTELAAQEPPRLDLALALQGFFTETQKRVTGDVRMKLYKGTCSVQGRRSPESLYDSRLANQSNLELFENQWAQGFTSLWTLPTRVAARLHPTESP